MAGRRSEYRRQIAGLRRLTCAVSVAIALWPVSGLAGEGPGAENQASDSAAGDSSGPAAEPASKAMKTPPAAASSPPDHEIEERGRLSIDAASLHRGGVLSLDLGLVYEARGDDPRPAVIVSGDGRRLELSAVPVAGKRDMVRIEVDADWLKPGSYLIQIRTLEKNSFPLRRYVLEVE